ncbi:hypothetical protein GOP47_0022117 [Adiantum capillus-veneris]|uniref:Uncharacterized protein n=1 Tax=Adiantum capillus-veneris TaxID=13818 RepID=A0A9D4U9D3_ADICA|nr:hypothetical protein GOP47_0022117 [Adiantum capillus-veneris]
MTDAVEGAEAVVVKACKHLAGSGGGACEVENAAVQEEHLGGGAGLMYKGVQLAAVAIGTGLEGCTVVYGWRCGQTDGARGGRMARERLVQTHLHYQSASAQHNQRRTLAGHP